MAQSGSQTAASAPELLELVKKKYGFVPNVLRELSASPAALQVYMAGQDALLGGELSDQDRQAVQLAVSAVNRCNYCQAVHTALSKQAGISPEDAQVIRSGGLPSDERLATVVDATRLVMDRSGWLDEAAVGALEQRGVSRGQLYEIIAFIGLKTISNYVNHIAHTTLDSQFSS